MNDIENLKYVFQIMLMIGMSAPAIAVIIMITKKRQIKRLDPNLYYPIWITLPIGLAVDLVLTVPLWKCFNADLKLIPILYIFVLFKCSSYIDDYYETKLKEALKNKSKQD